MQLNSPNSAVLGGFAAAGPGTTRSAMFVENFLEIFASVND